MNVLFFLFPFPISLSCFTLVGKFMGVLLISSCLSLLIYVLLISYLMVGKFMGVLFIFLFIYGCPVYLFSFFISSFGG